jgi:hypothetical protein
LPQTGQGKPEKVMENAQPQRHNLINSLSDSWSELGEYFSFKFIDVFGHLDFFWADLCAFEVAFAAPSAVWLVHNG